VVCHLNRGVNAIKKHEVAFYPFAKGEVFNVNVTCAGGWFLGVARGSATVFVFIN
jgi:hypothetical protein